MVKRVLIENSMSNIFEEAQTEWEYVGPIPRESVDFVEHCELCGHVNYIANFLLINHQTMKLLKVGSDCIRRFIILNGLGSIEDSNRFFDLKNKEREVIIELNILFKDVIDDLIPLESNVRKFKKMLMPLIENRGFILDQVKSWHLFFELNSHNKIDQVKDVLKKEIFSNRNLDISQVNKILSILYYPSEVVMRKEKKNINSKNIKEGSTWAKKGRVTHVTLAKSKVYKNPSDKYK